MNRTRLRKLSEVLFANANAEPLKIDVDLRSWGEVCTRRGGFLYLREVNCGTEACAIGVAVLSGVFKAEGFTYTAEKFKSYRGSITDLTPVYSAPSGMRYLGWEAVNEFFELKDDQAHNLFAKVAYEEGESLGPDALRAVATRINDMLVMNAAPNFASSGVGDLEVPA